MNTGIQDAANLAWKVALAASCDVSGPDLLQTYNEERHPVGADAVRFSGRWMHAGAQTAGWGALYRCDAGAAKQLMQGCAVHCGVLALLAGPA